jgi:hypothetical protein
MGVFLLCERTSGFLEGSDRYSVWVGRSSAGSGNCPEFREENRSISDRDERRRALVSRGRAGGISGSVAGSKDRDCERLIRLINQKINFGNRSEMDIMKLMA